MSTCGSVSFFTDWCHTWCRVCCWKTSACLS